MCDFCNVKIYVQVKRYLKPILAPLTEVEQLEYELINKTGIQYIQILNNYCPICRCRTKIERKGGQAMTKEQEVIKYIETRIKICNENADICDDNDFDEEATYLREESYMLETVLSMLKEKDGQIAKYEKIYKEYDCYRWVKELEKKDKQIDLMTEFIEKVTVDLKVAFGENMLWNRDEIKQYFERKASK